MNIPDLVIVGLVLLSLTTKPLSNMLAKQHQQEEKLPEVILQQLHSTRKMNINVQTSTGTAGWDSGKSPSITDLLWVLSGESTKEILELLKKEDKKDTYIGEALMQLQHFEL